MLLIIIITAIVSVGVSAAIYTALRHETRWLPDPHKKIELGDTVKSINDEVYSPVGQFKVIAILPDNKVRIMYDISSSTAQFDVDIDSVVAFSLQ